MPIIAIGLIVAAALGGSTAFMAQQSLPGDILWGFKVHVNESVAGALASSDSAKANWDLNSLNARLSEAQTLSAQGKLTASAQSQIETNFAEHTQGVESDIAKLQASGDTKDAADVAARYQALLAAQSPQGPLAHIVGANLDAASSLEASVNAAVNH